MKVVLANLVEELAAADAELFGRLGAIAATGDQGALDRSPLDLGQQGAKGHRAGRVGSYRDRYLGRLIGIEMLGKYGPAARGDDRAGDGVFELADVARPGTLADRHEGLARE